MGFVRLKASRQASKRPRDEQRSQTNRSADRSFSSPSRAVAWVVQAAAARLTEVALWRPSSWQGICFVWCEYVGYMYVFVGCEYVGMYGYRRYMVCE